MIPEAERVRLQFLLYYILLELLFPLACFMLLLLLEGHPTVIFGKISVPKTIWELEFSEHLV